MEQELGDLDEIEELISIFYHFFIHDSQDNVNQTYEYPKNIYYQESDKAFESPLRKSIIKRCGDELIDEDEFPNTIR